MLYNALSGTNVEIKNDFQRNTVVSRSGPEKCLVSQASLKYRFSAGIQQAKISLPKLDLAYLVQQQGVFVCAGSFGCTKYY